MKKTDLNEIEAFTQENGCRSVRIIDPDLIPEVKRFLLSLNSGKTEFYLADQITRSLQEWMNHESGLSSGARRAMSRLFKGAQEIVLYHGYSYTVLRPKIGVSRIVRLHPEMEQFEEVSREHYLTIRDYLVTGQEYASQKRLLIDFAPYFREFPTIIDPAEIGDGISFLNRNLSGQMYQSPRVFREALLRFVRDCHVGELNLLANAQLSSPEHVQAQIDQALAELADFDPNTPYSEVEHALRTHGFEAGWGPDVESIQRHLSEFSRLLQSPDARRVENFLERLPLVQTVVMLSPHGWFAQEHVLGKPDTGGQVTYVLNQARALERRLQERFSHAGIPDVKPRILILTRLIPEAEDSSCNVPREKVHGTEDCWILRVPFRDENDEPVPNWISRFQLWPYLERFADESADTVLIHLLRKPDLIIGNYSDGNLVAYLMADRLGVTHCAIAHALEKSKYLFSEIRWRELEDDYRFSLQFTADVLAYNSADFIVTSTHREIAGTDTEMGMYESYNLFTLPGLYQVKSGMDPYLARYNVVPPGANEEHFYPFTETDRRVHTVTERVEELLLGSEASATPPLKNPDLPPILSMARIDKVKNLAGLVEVFGKCSLREKANLVLISSATSVNESNDVEEKEEIEHIQRLIHEYNLEGHIQWAGVRLNKVETGEVYRVAAERKGLFAQPALMETFGLTVIEAMACGLPVVVTCFGGPAEIVVQGRSGLIENPNDYEAFGKACLDILTDEEKWEALSKGGIQRVVDNYSWNVHSDRILGLANVYSYWNYLNVMNREALDRYIHTLYHALFRPRVEAMVRS